MIKVPAFLAKALKALQRAPVQLKEAASSLAPNTRVSGEAVMGFVRSRRGLVILSTLACLIIGFCLVAVLLSRPVNDSAAIPEASLDLDALENLILPEAPLPYERYSEQWPGLDSSTHGLPFSLQAVPPGTKEELEGKAIIALDDYFKGVP